MSISCIVAATVLLVGQTGVKDDAVGTGLAAARGDLIGLNLRATFLNGQILDSTYLEAPFHFRLGSRQRFGGFSRLPFPSLDKAIEGMKVGGKRSFTLPAADAFGDLEVGEIPANTPLNFSVELLEVIKKGETPKLQIQDQQVGGGEVAKMGMKVTVNYRGKFLNGVVFDQSFEKPQSDGSVGPVPISFVLGAGSVVQGFEKGIEGMKVGGRRKVTMPYTFAYGENGRSPNIPPFTTLVFDLELIKVETVSSDPEPKDPFSLAR